MYMYNPDNYLDYTYTYTYTFILLNTYKGIFTTIGIFQPMKKNPTFL